MSGQKISFPPINGVGGLSQLCRGLNANFNKIQNAFNQRNTTQILYDTDHATARVLIGRTSNGSKKFVIAVSKEGVDVLRALSATRPRKEDFIFYSETVNEELEKNRKLFEATVEALKIVRDLFDTISRIDGMESINTSSLRSKIQEIERLSDND